MFTATFGPVHNGSSVIICTRKREMRLWELCCAATFFYRRSCPPLFISWVILSNSTVDYKGWRIRHHNHYDVLIYLVIYVFVYDPLLPPFLFFFFLEMYSLTFDVEQMEPPSIRSLCQAREMCLQHDQGISHSNSKTERKREQKNSTHNFWQLYIIREEGERHAGAK